MNKDLNNIDWSQISSPLSVNLFEKYLHHSIAPPLQSLGIDEHLWQQCRSLALNFAQQSFVDPISILYTSFKRHYSSNVSERVFTRWLLFNEQNQLEFPVNTLQYPIFQTVNELNNTIQSLSSTTNLDDCHRLNLFEQIWMFVSISIRLPPHGLDLTPEIVILDNDAIRFAASHRKSNTSRVHCFFAVTPSGKYSNQLYICKSLKNVKVTNESNSVARIIQTATGEISDDYFQHWLEDFVSSSFVTPNSALLIDPRTTLLTLDIQQLCEKSSLPLITVDVSCYLKQILSPLFSLIDKQWSEANRLDKMYLKPVGDFQRIISTTRFALRTLKRDDAIFPLFNKTNLWKDRDQQHFQSLQIPPPAPAMPKLRRKKRILVKTVMKPKLTTLMSDPPVNSTPEQIFSLIIQRQLSIARASKYLGGMKLDYFKYCLSHKMNSSSMTEARLVKLNEFMQSKSTINWLRELRSLYFWSCAKPLFLREIYQLTGIVAHKRRMNIYGNKQLGSMRSCDQQSPEVFWKAFEEMHRIQFDQEPSVDDQQWQKNFQQYLIEHYLHQATTPIWTIDAFEFCLTKNCSVLQLPEWNEQRPMNSSPKVTVIYAFSNDGQSIEPHFIFPQPLRLEYSETNEQESYNDLGHLTPSIFQCWFEKHFLPRLNSLPTLLIFCSRLPILSLTVLKLLHQHEVYPFGYPQTRTLPFRYFFERRVRNNRSTNLISDLWKRTLLDQRRTHVLKGIHCTVDHIKFYFQQIWPSLINEKHDEAEDDDIDDQQSNTFKDRCRQAFQQAQIEIKENIQPPDPSNHLIEQLDQLLTTINQLKERIQSNQVLRVRNEPIVVSPSTDIDSLSSMDSDPIPSSSDKRINDENDEPRAHKRLRSNSQTMDQSINVPLQWIPPSHQQISRFHCQSSSLFQFLLFIIHTILTSTQTELTDEQYRWLDSIVNLYNENSDRTKVNYLIETACAIVKSNLVR